MLGDERPEGIRVIHLLEVSEFVDDQNTVETQLRGSLCESLAGNGDCPLHWDPRPDIQLVVLVYVLQVGPSSVIAVAVDVEQPVRRSILDEAKVFLDGLELLDTSL